MGGNCSTIKDLHTNVLLKRLCDNESIPPEDSFWKDLLAYSINHPLNSNASKSFEDISAMLLKNFTINNPKTGNFITLLDIFIHCIQELHRVASIGIKEDNSHLYEACSALLIIRFAIKYFNELLPEELVLAQFKHLNEDQNTEAVVWPEELINALIEIIVDLPVTDATYLLQLEAVNTLIVILSCKIFRNLPAENLAFYNYTIRGKCAIHACLLVKKLVENFVAQKPVPAALKKGDKGSSSVLYDASSALASGLLSVVTLGYAGGRSSTGDSDPSFPIADQSLLLLLVLANHCVGNRDMKNPYRESLFSCTDSEADQEEKSACANRGLPARTLSKSSTPPRALLETTVPAGATFRVDMASLFAVLCTKLDQEASILLLYLLMHRNAAFRIALISRKDSDKAVLPILKILYHASHDNSHQLYMALIVLLMFTEDDKFTDVAHSMSLRQVNWITERQFTDISLGSLMVFILVRTIQQNLHQLKDKYLHTNCLAALANMSSRFHSLHPYTSQRLVGLIHHLSKRHARTVEKISLAAESVKSGVSPSTALGYSEEDFVQELAVLEEVTRMMLEIINSALSHRLAVNPHLVYSLLHQRDEFESFRSHPAFQDILQNIDKIMEFFLTRIGKEGTPDPSVNCVMGVIQGSANLLTKNQAIKKFPELKFKYVEEEAPDEFFIPYVWSLVCQKSLFYFNPAKTTLFCTPETMA